MVFLESFCKLVLQKLKKMNNYFTELLNEFNKKATAFAIGAEGEDIMIYPCGFAWITLGRKRNQKNKNSLSAKEMLGNDMLEAGVAGCHFDPATKSIKYFIQGYNQSCLHKEAHAEKLAKLLSEELGEEITWSSRLD